MAEKKVNENLRFYEVLKVVPEEAKKTIQGGRISGMTDISPQWRIGKMTEIFGPCGIGWKYEIIKQWQETYGVEVKAFTNINVYIKVDGEWSEPIPGTGGATLVEAKGYVSDEGFKMALTDALSVALKALGVGGDIYFSKGVNFFGTKYEADAQPEAAPAPSPKRASKAASAPAVQPTAQPASQPSNEPVPLPNALLLISSETTIDGLMAIWNGCPHLQTIKDFKDALSAKKQQLESGVQGVSFDAVLKEIEAAQDTRDLAAIYTKYPTFQKDANFTGALTARKDQLLNNGKS